MGGTIIQEELKAHGIGLQLFVPYNAKIADITHADTDPHLLTLANNAGTGAIAGETRKIIAVILSVYRVAGAGNLGFHPNEGALTVTTTNSSASHIVVILAASQRLQYELSVAGNDFDLYCYGYVVEA